MYQWHDKYHMLPSTQTPWTLQQRLRHDKTDWESDGEEDVVSLNTVDYAAHQMV